MAILESHERIGSIIEERYEITKILGEGGMGVVFEGLEIRLSRKVAIKLLHPHLSVNPELRARFVREAQAAATLEHESVVRIYAVGDLPDGASYIVMEFLDGESLASLLERHRRLDPHELYTLLAPAMDAIAYAHTLGIVHRDIKPDNIFLAKGARGIKTKVVDFGIAKIVGKGHMTATNSTLGTPLYMAPEQISGSRHVDAAADVWSMGVVIYQALSGAIPFDIVDPDNPMALLAKVMLEAPVPIEARLPDVPSAYAMVVNRALAKDVTQRFSNMGELLVALTHATQGLAAQSDFGAWGGPAFAQTFVTPPGASAPAVTPSSYAAPVSASPLDGAPVLAVTTPVQSEARRSASPLVLVVGVLVLLGLAGGASVFFASGPEQSPVASPTALTPPVVATTRPAVEVEPRDDRVADEPSAVDETDEPAATQQGANVEPQRSPQRGARPSAQQPASMREVSTHTSPASAATPSAMAETASTAMVEMTEPSRPSEQSCFRDVGNGVRIRVPCP